jgi:hypothetical protein
VLLAEGKKVKVSEGPKGLSEGVLCDRWRVLSDKSMPKASLWEKVQEYGASDLDKKSPREAGLSMSIWIF